MLAERTQRFGSQRGRVAQTTHHFPHPDRAERTPHPPTQERKLRSNKVTRTFVPQSRARGAPQPRLCSPHPPTLGAPPSPPQASLGQPRFGPSREIRAPDQHQHCGPQRPPVPSNKFLLRLRNAVYTSISIYSTNGFGVLPFSVPCPPLFLLQPGLPLSLPSTPVSALRYIRNKGSLLSVLFSGFSVS